jgi:HPt (histidine-containing phosphotransfer) domain-containing protein
MSDKKIVIDTEVLRKIIDYDREFEKELFQIFIENADFNIKKLETASKTNDNNLWYMASHALKGSSASIGAFPLSRVLEVSQKNSDLEIEKKIEIFQKIKEEFKKVEDYILQRLKA